MKKLLITIITVAGLSLSLNAQQFGFKKGDILLEGNIKISSNNQKETQEKRNSYTFIPHAGYFLSDKFAIGLGLNFGSTTNEDGRIEYKHKSNNFNAKVFGRYYFLELGKRFKTYTEVVTGYGTLKTELAFGTGNPKITTKQNLFNIAATVGANYFLTERIAINFQLANIIEYTNIKPKDEKALNSLDLKVGNITNPFNMANFGLTFKI